MGANDSPVASTWRSTSERAKELKLCTWFDASGADVVFALKKGQSFAALSLMDGG